MTSTRWIALPLILGIAMFGVACGPDLEEPEPTEELEETTEELEEPEVEIEEPEED